MPFFPRLHLGKDAELIRLPKKIRGGANNEEGEGGGEERAGERASDERERGAE